MKRILFALLLLLTANVFAADVTGRFDAGTAYEEPAAHAPARVSRMFARAVDKSAAVDLPATGNSGMIIWTIPLGAQSNGRALATKLVTRLVTPSGAVLGRADRGSLERGLRRFQIDAAETSELDLPRGDHEVLHVVKTAAAAYRLEVELPNNIAGAMVVAAEPDSTIVMSTWAAPLSRQPGESVTLHAELRDGDVAVTGAKVFARLASPRGRAFGAIELFDDGKHADGAANDGVYGAMVNDLPERIAGAWLARFEAEGTTAAGTRFLRSGSGEIIAEAGAARLDPRSVKAVVDGDVLRVSASAQVNVAGAYRFDAIVAQGVSGVAWGEGVRRLETGANALELEIPLEHLAGARLEDLRLDVRLLGLDTIGVAGRVAIDLK